MAWSNINIFGPLFVGVVFLPGSNLKKILLEAYRVNMMPSTDEYIINNITNFEGNI